MIFNLAFKLFSCCFFVENFSHVFLSFFYLCFFNVHKWELIKMKWVFVLSYWILTINFDSSLANNHTMSIFGKFNYLSTQKTLNQTWGFQTKIFNCKLISATKLSWAAYQIAFKIIKHTNKKIDDAEDEIRDLFSKGLWLIKMIFFQHLKLSSKIFFKFRICKIIKRILCLLKVAKQKERL